MSKNNLDQSPTEALPLSFFNGLFSNATSTYVSKTENIKLSNKLGQLHLKLFVWLLAQHSKLSCIGNLEVSTTINSILVDCAISPNSAAYEKAKKALFDLFNTTLIIDGQKYKTYVKLVSKIRIEGQKYIISLDKDVVSIFSTHIKSLDCGLFLQSKTGLQSALNGFISINELAFKLPLKYLYSVLQCDLDSIKSFKRALETALIRARYAGLIKKYYFDDDGYVQIYK